MPIIKIKDVIFDSKWLLLILTKDHIHIQGRNKNCSFLSHVLQYIA